MIRTLPPLLFSLTVLPLLAVSFALVSLAMPGQPPPAQYAAVLALSYLLGSVPWGYLLLKWRRGVDIRQYGSGRIGMTNALRTAGARVAALVLALDAGKGVLVVVLARLTIGATEADMAAGLAVLVGHNWPVFLGFRGGRGIATGGGVLAVVAPIAAAIGMVAFITATALSRYLSLGSISGVVVVSLALLALDLLGHSSTPYTLFGFLGGGIIIWQHRDNIGRILQGNERRLGSPATRVS